MAEPQCYVSYGRIELGSGTSMPKKKKKNFHKKRRKDIKQNFPLRVRFHMKEKSL